MDMQNDKQRNGWTDTRLISRQPFQAILHVPVLECCGNIEDQ